MDQVVETGHVSELQCGLAHKPSMSKEALENQGGKSSRGQRLLGMANRVRNHGMRAVEIICKMPRTEMLQFKHLSVVRP